MGMLVNLIVAYVNFFPSQHINWGLYSALSCTVSLFCHAHLHLEGKKRWKCKLYGLPYLGSTILWPAIILFKMKKRWKCKNFLSKYFLTWTWLVNYTLLWPAIPRIYPIKLSPTLACLTLNFYSLMKPEFEVLGSFQFD